MQNLPGVANPPGLRKCIWDKQNLFANDSLCLDSSQYAIFSQSLINADIFTPRTDPDILMKVFGDYTIFLIWAAWVLFNFYLKQK